MNRISETSAKSMASRARMGSLLGLTVRRLGWTTPLKWSRVESRPPKTFDHDGEMSDDDCLQYMVQYSTSLFNNSEDMISQSFWIKFLYRRVTVFDNNDSFNYNEKLVSLRTTSWGEPETRLADPRPAVESEI